MRKIIITGVLLFISNIYSQKIEKFEMLPLKNFYTNPVVSPDGKHLLLTGEHLKGVYLLDVKTNRIKEITKASGAGYGYSWNDNSEKIYFRIKEEGDYYSNAKIFSYDLNSQKISSETIGSAKYLPNYKGNINTSPQISINLNTLQLEVQDFTTSKSTKTITKNDGQYYHPIISNDGKKVAVHDGASIYIYFLDNSSDRIKIGEGIASQWSTNDKYILGYLDTSKDGHVVENSELYLFDIENQKRIQLTNTEIITEMYPTLHGNTIYYSDDKSGKILKSKLNLK